MAARTGASEVETGGRRLPDGVSGMLVVGQLRHIAPSTRSKNQLLLDVETVSADGRIAIESLSGWMMEAGETGELTPLGAAFAQGELAPLVGREVFVQVSCRAALTNGGARLYVTANRVWSVDAGSAS